MEASPMRTAETVLLHWVLDFLAVVCVAVGAWLGGSRWRPKVQVERAVAGVGGTGWAEDALRRYNFELIQAERLRSRKVMEQAMTVALRGYRGMEPPDIAKIVSRVIAEMNELNEIAEQRRQQAVDRPTPFTSVP
jgi:hypothetical protein